MERVFCVITFNSTHLALKFERISKEQGLRIRSIPVPRQISSSCGIAAKFAETELRNIQLLCHNYLIEFEGIYRVYRDPAQEPLRLV